MTNQGAQSFRLDGRVAVVTGGGSGIGQAIALKLAAHGAVIRVLDLNESAAASTCQQISAAGGATSAHLCDVTSQPDVKALFDQFFRRERIHILINNAGIGLVGNIEETALDDFQRLLRVNVEGLFLVTKYAMPLLLASKGCIVNIGSVAGLVGVKRRFAYCATKGAVVAITRQIAVDYPTALRVNCICPGTVDTPFVEAYLEKYHKNEKEKVRAELNQRQPIGRMGRPEEIASLALYLSAKESDFVNGSVITIDGGWTAA